MIIWVIVADSLDPSFYLETAFISEDDADQWLEDNPSNEIVGYRKEAVRLENIYVRA